MLAVSTSTSTSSAAGSGTGTSSRRRPGSDAGFRSASIVSPIGRNHADPGSPLRVVTDATPRSASTLDVTPMKRFFHGRNLLYLGVGSAALVIATVLILVSVIGSLERGDHAVRSHHDDDRDRRIHPGASEGTGRGRHRGALSRHPAAAEPARQPQGKGDDDRVRRPAVPLLPPVRARHAPGDHQGVRSHGQGEARLLRDPDHRRELGAGPARGLRRRAPEQALELLAPALQEPGRPRTPAGSRTTSCAGSAGRFPASTRRR